MPHAAIKAESPARSEIRLSSVVAIIPCLDEASAIGSVVADVFRHGIERVIVVDGGSTDETVEYARAAGAEVIVETRRGYGRAMMSGLAAIGPDCQVVLFLDGDGSDLPDRIPDVVGPILSHATDLVLGSRLRGEREPGSLNTSQIVAGHLSGALIRLLYGVRFTDMSPFRAIQWEALQKLGMREESFGWNLEMQMRAAAAGLRIAEVAVGQRRRMGGASKVSGNLVVSARVALALARTFVRLARTVSRDRQATAR